MGFNPFNQPTAMVLQAATPVAGFTKQNGTPTILTWTPPADGQQHRFLVVASETVTTAETGGGIGTTHTAPGGGTQVGGTNIFAGGKATGTYHQSDGAVCAAGQPVTVNQSTALTLGAAVVWVEIWGS